MNERIDNKLAFNRYIWITFFLFIMIAYVAFIFIGFKSGNKELIHHLRSNYIFIGPIFAIIASIYNYLIRPAYFEAIITTDQIIIKSFNPNLRNDARVIMMLFRKYIAEYKISRQTYNNYKIQIERFGFKRSLTPFRNTKIFIISIIKLLNQSIKHI